MGQVRGEKMRRGQRRKHAEPEDGELGEDFAFARNRVRQNNIEGGDSVSGDDEKSTVIDDINLAHFTGGE